MEIRAGRISGCSEPEPDVTLCTAGLRPDRPCCGPFLQNNGPEVDRCGPSLKLHRAQSQSPSHFRVTQDVVYSTLLYSMSENCPHFVAQILFVAPYGRLQVNCTCLFGLRSTTCFPIQLALPDEK